MNVSQLETLLDMTRANIRFYEQEGLVCPRREKNGYRDYSEEDTDTLRKIKLLRQLGLSLESIRRLQRGELSLDAALREREAQLAAERSELEWAAGICRQIRQEGAEYQALDARRYLERLDRPAAGEGRFTLDTDALPTVSHPWRRYFARSLDLGVYGLLWAAVQLLVLRWNPDPNVLVRLLERYIGYALMLGVEPLLLCTLGTTPGKGLFGLEVRDGNGRKLSFRSAFRRTWGVFCQGMGCGVPIYQLYRNYKSYRACERGEALSWEAETVYRIQDDRAVRCLGYVAAEAAVFALLLVLTAQAFLPIHRGTLTPEQYADNVNDMSRFLQLDSDERMEADGTWRDGAPHGGVVIDLWDSGPTPAHQLTVTDGQVTGVRIEIERSGVQLIGSYTVQKQLAAIALCAAQKSYNGISWMKSGVLDAIAEQGFADYTLQAGDVTITQSVEQRGYLDGTEFLFAQEGADPCLHLVFTLEKTS